MFANHITNETAGDSDAGIDVVKDRRDEGREEPAGAA
jgi:hypothetical protein